LCLRLRIASRGPLFEPGRIGGGIRLRRHDRRHQETSCPGYPKGHALTTTTSSVDRPPFRAGPFWSETQNKAELAHGVLERENDRLDMSVMDGRKRQDAGVTGLLQAWRGGDIDARERLYARLTGARYDA
jgi:hypothetical protein